MSDKSNENLFTFGGGNLEVISRKDIIHVYGQHTGDANSVKLHLLNYDIVQPVDGDSLTIEFKRDKILVNGTDVLESNPSFATQYTNIALVDPNTWSSKLYPPDRYMYDLGSIINGTRGYASNFSMTVESDDGSAYIFDTMCDVADTYEDFGEW